MKIALDIRKAFDKRGGGMSVVANQLAINLLKYFPNHEYIILPHTLRLPQSVESVVQEIIWKQLILPIELLIKDADIAFYTYPMVPLISLKSNVAVIYDLQFWSEPSEKNVASRFALAMVKFTATKSRKVITISHFSKNEIVNYLKIKPEKVVVAYPGCEHITSYQPEPIESFRQKYNLPHKYILVMIGTFAKRKNSSILLKAYSSLPKYLRSAYKLVIVAERKGPDWPLVQRMIADLGLSDDVMIIPYVSSGRGLVSLFRYAEMLVHATMYEGFGLPVLEAMAAGIPVIASNRSSLPEIVDGAALLVDPTNVQELSTAILEIIQNDGLKQELKRKGIARSHYFSWRRMAETVVKVFEEVTKKGVICK